MDKNKTIKKTFKMNHPRTTNMTKSSHLSEVKEVTKKMVNKTTNFDQTKKSNKHFVPQRHSTPIKIENNNAPNFNKSFTIGEQKSNSFSKLNKTYSSSDELNKIFEDDVGIKTDDYFENIKINYDKVNVNSKTSQKVKDLVENILNGKIPAELSPMNDIKDETIQVNNLEKYIWCPKNDFTLVESHETDVDNALTNCIQEYYNRLIVTQYISQNKTAEKCTQTECSYYSLCEPCDENEYVMKSIIKRLKIGIAMYGCNFHEISKTLFTSGVSGTNLYALFCQHILKK